MLLPAPLLFILAWSDGLISSPDMHGTYLELPVKVLKVAGRYYILDQRAKTIRVFDRKAFLFSMGSAGEGPGEFQNPVSMTHAAGRLYTIDAFSGKINSFPLDGSPPDAFTLPGPDLDRAFIGDLFVQGDRVYVAYNKGPTLLRIYALDEGKVGTYIGEIAKGAERYPRESSNLYRIHQVDATRLDVFSMLDGGMYTVSLPEGRVVAEIPASMPHLRPILDDLRKEKEQEGDLRDPSQISVINLPLYFPLQRHGDAWMLVARRPTQKGGHTYHTATWRDGSYHLDFLNLPATIEDRVGYLETFDTETLVLPADGNLYFIRSIL